MADTDFSFINGPNGRLAYAKRAGAEPGILWLGGFRSDMTGTKAAFIDEWANKRRRRYIRFDYSGHGASDGAFEDGSIGQWTADAIKVVDALCPTPNIIVGSSMGAWIAALLAVQRPNAVAGIVFIAPAPDFTERLVWPTLTENERAALKATGVLKRPSEYSEDGETFTQKLFDDGREHSIMNDSIAIDAPVRILQGMRDEAVPWRHALDFAELITGDDLIVNLVKDGDHRLSREQDLTRLAHTLDEIAQA